MDVDETLEELREALDALKIPEKLYAIKGSAGRKLLTEKLLKAKWAGDIWEDVNEYFLRDAKNDLAANTMNLAKIYADLSVKTLESFNEGQLIEMISGFSALVIAYNKVYANQAPTSFFNIEKVYKEVLDGLV